MHLMEFHGSPKKLIVILSCVIVVFLLFHIYILSPLLVGKDELVPSELFTSFLGKGVGVATNKSSICTYIPAQLLPLRELSNCFYMFRVTVINVVRLICEAKHWKWKVMTNDSYIMQTLGKLISARDTLFIVHDSSSAFKIDFFKNITRSKCVLISSISKAYTVTGTKQSQLVYSRKLTESFGCTLNQLKIFPKSFLASEVKDCSDFHFYIAKRPDSSWIVKPYGGIVGKGIKIYQHVPALLERFKECGRKQHTNHYVIQEYLPNLLLLNGRKFDIRAFVLIARTDPYFLYYHPGYLRVAVNRLSEADGREVHLTNTHIQEQIEGFTPEDHYWTFDRFQKYISNISSNNDQFVKTILEPIIKQTGLFLLQAGLGTLERLPATYLLLGLDFMVTSDYHVWFIEANNTPLWPSFVSDSYTMGGDMLDLVVEIHSSPDRFVNSQPGEKYGSWELVYNELLADCSGYQYNPCRDFPIQS